MSDLIERQAAIDALDGEIEITGRVNAETVKGYVKLVKDRIERLPPAQPERKSGKWIDKWHNDSRYCDQCGAVLEGDYWYWRNNYYCYHCGAKMEVKE